MPKLMQFLKDKTVVIARKTQQTGTDKFLASTVTSAQMHIQPLSQEKAELYDGVFGKTYTFYMDAGIDILPGDKLTDEDGEIYKVVTGGVSKRDFGSFNHKEVIVEKI